LVKNTILLIVTSIILNLLFAIMVKTTLINLDLNESDVFIVCFQII